MKPTKDSDEDPKLHDSLQRFRDDIQKQRSRIVDGDETYEDVFEDPDYQQLLEKGDVTLTDEELQEKQRLHLIKNRPPRNDGFEPKPFLPEEGEEEAEEKAPTPFFTPPPPTPEQEEREASRKFNRELESIIERNRRDFETFVGTNLMSIIGGAMVVLGLIIGVGYLFQQGYIQETGKLSIALFFGVAAYVVAHLKRHSIPLLSNVMVIGGTVILYFTCFLFFEYYSISNPLVAYSLNFAVTGVAIVFAILHHRKTLAYFATVGGYLTPLLVDEPQVNLLFIYLFLLNAFMLFLAHRKSWPYINLMTYAFSLVIFGGWLIGADFEVARSQTLALTFATLYYVVFLFMNIIHSLATDSPLSRFNFYMLMTNTGFYVLGVVWVLVAMGAYSEIGVFFFVLAAFNWGYAYLLYRYENTDIQLFHTVVGFTLFFVAVAPWILFDNATLNIIWAIEAVALLWLGFRAKIPIVRNTSLILMGLTLITMFIAWFSTYSNEFIDFIVNGGVRASIITMSSLFFTVWLLSREDEQADIANLLSVSAYRDILRAVAIAILFLTGNVELAFHRTFSAGSEELKMLLMGLYNTFFVIFLWGYARQQKLQALRTNAAYFCIIAALSYFVVGHWSTNALRDEFLYNGASILPFSLHYVNVFAGFLGLFLILRDLRSRDAQESVEFTWLTYLISILFVVHISIEVGHILALSGYSLGADLNAEGQTIRKVTLFVLWGIIATLLIAMGMRMRIKELRFSGLSVFGLIVLKFFFFDFWKLLLPGRIISLLVVGLLFLGVSFLYGQIKKALIDGEVEELARAAGFHNYKTENRPPEEEEEE